MVAIETGRGFVLHSDEVIKRNTLNYQRVALTSTSEIFEDLQRERSS